LFSSYELVLTAACGAVLPAACEVVLIAALTAVLTSVSDPYSFFPDPDPEFEAGDQYGSGSNPDSGL
jgi:hypothetical protein